MNEEQDQLLIDRERELKAEEEESGSAAAIASLDDKPSCFTHINPDDQKCVPNCLLFIECYNKTQEKNGDLPTCFGARKEAYRKCEICRHIEECSGLTLKLEFDKTLVIG